MLKWSSEGVPNTEEKRNADPNPTASPIAFVSGACMRPYAYEENTNYYSLKMLTNPTAGKNNYFYIIQTIYIFICIIVSKTKNHDKHKYVRQFGVWERERESNSSE